MQRTLFILMLILFSNFSGAQSNNYDDSWKKVEQLEKEGLTKSALEIVETIASKASKDKNDPQLIKTTLFKSKYALILEEDAQLKIINDFKQYISKSNFPTKNVLENTLANLYWQYFQQNRWKFYNRTKTSEKVNTEDFRTWDLETLFKEVHLYFQSSIENGLMLQLEPLEKYNAILSLQKNSKTYRPTLFDFLNHNALEFYKTNETHITKPAYKFEIDNPDFITDAKTFSKLNITSKDTTSLQLNALKTYQELIKFHLNDKTPEALANVNIERLKFVQQHATFSDKANLLIAALKTESVRLKSHEVSGLYNFEIASAYKAQGDTYTPKTKEEHHWKIKEALEICNSVIEKYPDTNGAQKCITLKTQIKQASLQIVTESFLPIQQDARILVTYKNLDVLRLKAYRLSHQQLKQFSKTYRQNEQWAFIQKLDPHTTWESKLKNENDYQTHSTEVLVPKLNNGIYLIVATTKENSSKTFAFAPIQVTNMALVDTETPKDKIFQIIDRNHGVPIANVKVELTYSERNHRTPKTKVYTTNTLGEIKIPKDNSWRNNVTLKVMSSNDTAYFGDFYINRFYKPHEEKPQYNAFIFTDRSIYRPTQTVYFKAIAIKRFNNKSEVLDNTSVSVMLFNANGEKVKTHKLNTNAFGSVSGEFILPNNGLNGQYRIDLHSDKFSFRSSHYFSVEEYKRPKFETKFKPVTKTFKVNDNISVKGTAIAYAGSNITDAKVVYRVHRKVQYPRWCYWYYPNFNSEPQEITHGESITNNKGEFEITFKALPDQSVDKSNLPIFNYEITADVTDINGETRSATTIVNVGYHALVANLDVAPFLDKTKKDHTLSINTKNLNGEFVPAKGTIKIYKLKAPNAVLRQRPWTAPDYQDIDENTFKKLFPHDAYTNEDNPNNWKKGDLVLEKTFDTKTSKTLKLSKIKNWTSGQYLMLLESKDKFGQFVKDETKTILFSKDDKTIADNQLFSVTTDKTEYAIGDTAYITFASAAKNIAVTIAVEKDETSIKTEVITLNNNKKTISVPVTAEDLGGFVVHYSLAAFNSFTSGSQSINVPYPKTDLDIETLTFRDKLQPGTDETWQFKIKGPKGDKVSAELLASMYDASLDQFKAHYWDFNPIYNPIYNAVRSYNHNQSFGTENFRVHLDRIRTHYSHQAYDQLNWFGFYFGNKFFRRRTYNRSAVKSANYDNRPFDSAGALLLEHKKELELNSEEQLNAEEDASYLRGDVYNKQTNFRDGDKESSRSFDTFGEKDIRNNNSKKEQPNFDNITIRKNLQETAFFFPQLSTDDKGHVNFSFTTPEALTQWKLQLLAHTKSLESVTKILTTVTQKELMVIPNAPRFLREGDQITISTKIANLSDQALSGQAKLILTDAISGKDITTDLLRKLASSPPQGELEGASFTVSPKGNTNVSWQLSIPDTVQAVQYKILATTGDFSDGEQNALPVLSNRMLVTETLPMWIKSNATKTFTLDKLKTNTSSSLKHHKLTLEMTSNPAWYAVQALPYLMEYPHECNEQIFSRYYANALASHIANSNPRIQEVFNQWASQDALMSNLEKNEELKSILIQETPWLRDAQSETEQKKRIALLFNLNKMNNELQSAINKLKANQMGSGAWSWFRGGYENRFITQHIITGFGHLSKLGVTSSAVEMSMIKKAINYLDAQFVKEYKDIRKYNANVDLSKDHLSYSQLHYLYMRSFYPELKTSKQVQDIINYYQTQIKTYWLSRSLYAKGLMVLISHRANDTQTATKILKSLKENSITSEELGMYWKANTKSWYWYQAPIETQALLIEAFSEAGNSIQNETKHLETIDNLKIWLLKNKQTNRWKTTKATSDAVYALLLQGSDWLSVTDMVDVVIGKQKITPSKLENVKVEAGTGYYKTSWSSSEIKPEMGDVKLTKKGDGIAWGGLYWQYFEDLDKISSAETPLQLKKKLFLKKNTDTGEEITEITNNTKLKVGDLVKVRIELKSDRAMEFVHMKDMRAAGLEPTNVISTYKWQDGLGYYESTKDASTNFFFDYLPKGVYVFEYDLRVNNAGNMSNGITTIQSMYAPEFSSHSEGVRIKIE